MSSGPTGIIAKLVELLQAHPEGLTSGEMRAKLGLKAEEQAQFDRRRRDIRRWYHLEKKQVGNRAVYTLGQKLESESKSGKISLKLRAEVLHHARGRCQMCGKTVVDDEITLVVDHKTPQDWGGTDDPENLWAICEDCNHGKKNHFSSQDQSLMRKVMGHKSIHVRIGELLKQNIGKAVPSKLIEFVANQDDWKKRTRELRYLGWQIEASRAKDPSGRVKSSYTLHAFSEWPSDPTGWIRNYEKERAKRGEADAIEEDE